MANGNTGILGLLGNLGTLGNDPTLGLLGNLMNVGYAPSGEGAAETPAQPVPAPQTPTQPPIEITTGPRPTYKPTAGPMTPDQVPSDVLDATAMTESNFDHQATGPKLKKPGGGTEQAIGAYQIRPSTAADYGVTDPEDLRDSTIGRQTSAKILADYYNQLYKGGELQHDADWRTVMAAYNMGVKGFRDAGGDVTDLPGGPTGYLSRFDANRTRVLTGQMPVSPVKMTATGTAAPTTSDQAAAAVAPTAAVPPAATVPTDTAAAAPMAPQAPQPPSAAPPPPAPQPSAGFNLASLAPQIPRQGLLGQAFSDPSTAGLLGIAAGFASGGTPTTLQGVRIGPDMGQALQQGIKNTLATREADINDAYKLTQTTGMSLDNAMKVINVQRSAQMWDMMQPYLSGAGGPITNQKMADFAKMLAFMSGDPKTISEVVKNFAPQLSRAGLINPVTGQVTQPPPPQAGYQYNYATGRNEPVYAAPEQPPAGTVATTDVQRQQAALLEHDKYLASHGGDIVKDVPEVDAQGNPTGRTSTHRWIDLQPQADQQRYRDLQRGVPPGQLQGAPATTAPPVPAQPTQPPATTAQPPAPIGTTQSPQEVKRAEENEARWGTMVTGYQTQADAAEQLRAKLDQMRTQMKSFTPGKGAELAGQIGAWGYALADRFPGLGLTHADIDRALGAPGAKQSFDKFAGELVINTTKQLGTREAAQVVNMIQNRVSPSGEMTPQALDTVMSMIDGLARYHQAKYARSVMYKYGRDEQGNPTGQPGDPNMDVFEQKLFANPKSNLRAYMPKAVQ